MASKEKRERIAIELKQWLRSQSRYKTIRELEAPTGIPYSSLRDYFCGGALPVGDRLRRLATLTGSRVLLGMAAVPPDLAGTNAETGKERAAREVLMALHRLLAELDFFKRGSAEDRALLRRFLPARDVGYLTTLLKAMYDEDQFQAWVYFTDYEPVSR